MYRINSNSDSKHTNLFKDYSPFYFIWSQLPPYCPHTLTLQGHGPSCHSCFKILCFQVGCLLYLKCLGNSLANKSQTSGPICDCSHLFSFSTLSSYNSLSHNVWPRLNHGIEFSSSLFFLGLFSAFNMPGAQQVLLTIELMDSLFLSISLLVSWYW